MSVHPEQAKTSGGPGNALADQLMANPRIERRKLLSADQPSLQALNYYGFT